jgi:NADH-quinone oxidoreductase subunit J
VLTLFYVAAVVTAVATLLAITRPNAVRALMYLVVSLFGAAVVLFAMGAPFVAALEVIVYAGAIMVLFLFVIMVVDLGRGGLARERRLLSARAWVGPGVLALILFVEVLYILASDRVAAPAARGTSPAEVGEVLLGPYLLAVELASMLLLAGIVGAYHIARSSCKQRGTRAGGAR